MVSGPLSRPLMKSPFAKTTVRLGVGAPSNIIQNSWRQTSAVAGKAKVGEKYYLSFQHGLFLNPPKAPKAFRCYPKEAWNQLAGLHGKKHSRSSCRKLPISDFLLRAFVLDAPEESSSGELI